MFITCIMKQILSLLFLISVAATMVVAQSDLPGQTAVEAVYGIDVELNLTKCCFAAYGWHIAIGIKSDEVGAKMFSVDNIAEQLFEAGISNELEEQFFNLDDGRYLVVSSASNFEKVLGRYLINVKSQNR
jgi:hypothetical protein